MLFWNTLLIRLTSSARDRLLLYTGMMTEKFIDDILNFKAYGRLLNAKKQNFSNRKQEQWNAMFFEALCDC